MTPKQKRFCEEYMIDLNATQAAIRAGYKPGGAKDQGSDLTKKPDCRAYIAKLQAEASKRTGVNADRIILELARIGFVNTDELLDPVDATVRPGADHADMAAIQTVKVKQIPLKDGTFAIEREIRMHDKIKALDKLGEHLGMWGRNRSQGTDEGTGVVILPEILPDEPQQGS